MLGRSNNAMGIQSDVPGMKRGTLRPYFTVHWGDLSGVAGRAYGTFTFSDVHSCVSSLLCQCPKGLQASNRNTSVVNRGGRSSSWMQPAVSSPLLSSLFQQSLIHKSRRSSSSSQSHFKIIIKKSGLFFPTGNTHFPPFSYVRRPVPR
jgi:hypothetical protein